MQGQGWRRARPLFEVCLWVGVLVSVRLLCLLGRRWLALYIIICSKFGSIVWGLQLHLWLAQGSAMCLDGRASSSRLRYSWHWLVASSCNVCACLRAVQGKHLVRAALVLPHDTIMGCHIADRVRKGLNHSCQPSRKQLPGLWAACATRHHLCGSSCFSLVGVNHAVFWSVWHAFLVFAFLCAGASQPASLVYDTKSNGMGIV